jgi:hypothetical protein
MESLILVAETSICVVLMALVREGMRRKSEGLMAITLFLLIPAITSLLKEIMTDPHSHDLQSGQMPYTQEERERAMEKVSKEWAEFVEKRMMDPNYLKEIPNCFPQVPPADATDPAN